MPKAFTAVELETAVSARFSEARMVRFQDVDAAGILFYPRMLEYFSDVYIEMLLASGFDLATALQTSSMGVPLVHAEADYKKPLRFGDAVAVEIIGVRIGTTSFRVGYRVKTAEGELASIGQTVHVCLDRTTFEPGPIPEAFRAVLGNVDDTTF